MSERDSDWGEDDFDIDDDINEFRHQRGFTMRHPILLVGVLVGALFLAHKTWPRAAYFFLDPTDCGVLIDRPVQEFKKPGSAPKFVHNTYCTLKGINEQLSSLATPKKDGQQPFAKGRYESQEDLAGVKYYVKLAGGNVIGVLPADRKDVYRFRERKGSITGFEFDEPGRLIDTAKDPKLRKTGQVLRIRYAIPDKEKLWIFDVTDRPEDRWTDLVIVGLMGFTALLALFGLVRLLLNRRE